MSRTDRFSEPIAVHTAQLGDRRVVVVVHPGFALVRNSSDGAEITRHDLPYPAEKSVCLAYEESPLLIANSAEKVFVYNLGDATSEHIGSCASNISALTAGLLGGKLVVAAGDRRGSVGVFTLDDAEWSHEVISAHRNTVMSVSLGKVRGRPSIVSCANDTTVTHTSIGTKASRVLWRINWERDSPSSADVSCTWLHHGNDFLFDLEQAIHARAWRSDSGSAVELLHSRMEAVQKCAVVNSGRLSFIVVTGKDVLDTMMSVGELPSRSVPLSHTMAFASPGRLAVVLPIRGGALLALTQGSSVRITSVRVTRTWHWFYNSMCLLGFGVMLSVIRDSPSLWPLLFLTVPMAFQVLQRPTVRSVAGRDLVDIDLHSEAIDVDFDGPDAFVTLSHGGVATFDLSDPRS
ncbi:hypothetical protein OG272_40650 [Streptomyces sp. NBC_00104]|uniref:hypothetical protein n=1 Tax=unclassified Streptomyces TaxID=2593676 RepID=UPI002E246A86